ncbi:hypothetical protein JQC91_07750 [Jannaschia sp. Os4]|uniref:DUF5333 family protein n=1 Tax=Jannaschia sp. Os4 TaxID=2807617 RepID=UPI001939DA03|nr:DUF5333 family protein [Jannaschia sp. Os4]MBM2576196.1 hypothetical protein [Jannaschia sp. Os4]
MRAVALLLCATPAMAQEPAPSPDYFVEGVVASAAAQAVALACPTLSVDLGAAARLSEDVLARLTADGFDPQNLLARMEDPQPAIAALQDAFLARHGLAEGAPSEVACAAGRTELEEGSAIGALLLEVDG